MLTLMQMSALRVRLTSMVRDNVGEIFYQALAVPINATSDLDTFSYFALSAQISFFSMSSPIDNVRFHALGSASYKHTVHPGL